jgi:cytochrome d ubiquinol oxidase subunit II
METLWLLLILAMMVVYAVLDGLDLGAGLLHLFAGRNAAGREQAARFLAPGWNGNEVWLLAAGGALYFALPRETTWLVWQFYVPFLGLFWLLIVRGLSMEVRRRTVRASVRWTSGITLAAASALLAILLGMMLGGAVLGGTAAGFRFVNWYTMGAGVTALASLVMVGALRIADECGGSLRERLNRMAAQSWVAVVSLFLGVAAATLAMRPELAQRFTEPLGCFLPALAIAGLAGVRAFETPRQKLVSACAYVAGVLASVAAGVLPSLRTTGADFAGPVWWIVPGMLVMASYFSVVCRHHAGASPAAAERGTRPEVMAGY